MILTLADAMHRAAHPVGHMQAADEARASAARCDEFLTLVLPDGMTEEDIAKSVQRCWAPLCDYVLVGTRVLKSRDGALGEIGHLRFAANPEEAALLHGHPPGTIHTLPTGLRHWIRVTDTDVLALSREGMPVGQFSCRPPRPPPATAADERPHKMMLVRDLVSKLLMLDMDAVVMAKDNEGEWRTDPALWGEGGYLTSPVTVADFPQPGNYPRIKLVKIQG